MSDGLDASPTPSLSLADFRNRCPRCGEGALFDGFLALRPRCDACDLDYSLADTGDGPAVFVIFLAGFVAVAAVFIVRFSWDGPVLLALIVGLVVAIAVSLAGLRPVKSALVALQYRNKAAEGRQE